MDLTQLCCEDFLSQLASKAPAPGGGGAAALAGALGAALCTMVASLTTGKKKYDHVESEIQELLKELTDLGAPTVVLTGVQYADGRHGAVANAALAHRVCTLSHAAI